MSVLPNVGQQFCNLLLVVLGRTVWLSGLGCLVRRHAVWGVLRRFKGVFRTESCIPASVVRMGVECLSPFPNPARLSLVTAGGGDQRGLEVLCMCF